MDVKRTRWASQTRWVFFREQGIVNWRVNEPFDSVSIAVGIGTRVGTLAPNVIKLSIFAQINLG